MIRFIRIILCVSILLNIALGVALYKKCEKLKYKDMNYIQLKSDYYTLNENCGEIREKYYDVMDIIKQIARVKSYKNHEELLQQVLKNLENRT